MTQFLGYCEYVFNTTAATHLRHFQRLFNCNNEYIGLLLSCTKSTVDEIFPHCINSARRPVKVSC